VRLAAIFLVRTTFVLLAVLHDEKLAALLVATFSKLAPISLVHQENGYQRVEGAIAIDERVIAPLRPDGTGERTGRRV
jgi:hypothetical protein